MFGYFNSDIHATLFAAENKGSYCTDALNCFIYTFNWGFTHGDGIGGRNFN